MPVRHAFLTYLIPCNKFLVNTKSSY